MPTCNVSIIIASLLNTPTILKTIESIINQTEPAQEVFIIAPESCLKENNEIAVKIKDYFSITCIAVPFKGQVKQRIYGFQIASGNFVMQLDDDVVIPADAIAKFKILADKFQGQKVAIGPILYNRLSKKYVASSIDLKNRLRLLLIDSLIGGAAIGMKKFGKISPSLNPYSLPISQFKREVMPVEFLPGGCIFISKEALVIQNYFPFEGKAYCEDIIHSILLRRNKVTLLATKEVIVSFEDNADRSEAESRLRHEFNIKKYICRRYNKGVLARITAYYYILRVANIISHIKRFDFF